MTALHISKKKKLGTNYQSRGLRILREVITQFRDYATTLNSVTLFTGVLTEELDQLFVCVYSDFYLNITSINFSSYANAREELLWMEFHKPCADWMRQFIDHRGNMVTVSSEFLSNKRKRH